MKDQEINRPSGRDGSGRFAAGVSGNPRGRPRGTRSPQSVLLAELLDGDGAAIVAKLVDQAKQGEPWAVRLCVERLLPRHERRVSIELPAVEDAESVGEAIASVISFAAAGEITIEEARGFLALLEQQRKGIETAELAVRLEVLESDARDEKRKGRRS